jgi:DUF4097 and DUF4098 domain-containing protein YvlB
MTYYLCYTCEDISNVANMIKTGTMQNTFDGFGRGLTRNLTDVQTFREFFTKEKGLEAVIETYESEKELYHEYQSGVYYFSDNGNDQIYVEPTSTETINQTTSTICRRLF